MQICLHRSQWPCPGVFRVPPRSGVARPRAGNVSLEVTMRPGASGTCPADSRGLVACSLLPLAHPARERGVLCRLGGHGKRPHVQWYRPSHRTGPYAEAQLPVLVTSPSPPAPAPTRSLGDPPSPQKASGDNAQELQTGRPACRDHTRTTTHRRCRPRLLSHVKCLQLVINIVCQFPFAQVSASMSEADVSTVLRSRGLNIILCSRVSHILSIFLSSLFAF